LNIFFAPLIFPNRKTHHAIFLFPKEKWQKRKRPHSWIPRQIFNLFAKKYRLPRGGPIFFYAPKSQFVAWYSASAGIVLALKNDIPHLGAVRF